MGLFAICGLSSVWVLACFLGTKINCLIWYFYYWYLPWLIMLVTNAFSRCKCGFYYCLQQILSSFWFIIEIVKTSLCFYFVVFKKWVQAGLEQNSDSYCRELELHPLASIPDKGNLFTIIKSSEISSCCDCQWDGYKFSSWFSFNCI